MREKTPHTRRSATAKRVLVLLAKTPACTRAHINGILRYCRVRKTGWAIDIREVYTPTPGSIDLTDRYFDGIICNAFPRSPWLLKALAVPAVILYDGLRRLKIPKRVPWHADIYTDNFAVAAHAVDYLLGRGFTSFAYVGGEFGGVWSQERAMAVSHCLSPRRDCRLQIYPKVSAAMARDFSLEKRTLGAWLKALPPKTAVIAANDFRAEQVLDVCRLTGIEVPRDLAVIGFDNNVERCEASSPTLTSVAIGFEDAGFLAAKALDEYFGHCNFEKTIRGAEEPTSRSKSLRFFDSSTPRSFSAAYASPAVVARESTDERLSSDALVRRALELINAANGVHVSVASLVRDLRVSKSSLVAHFQSALGRPPSAEIARVRLDYLKSLLRDPALTRTELTERCGFSSNPHLAYFFRLHTGMTIDQFRKSR